MNHFKDCPIDKDIVILASGKPLEDVPIEVLNNIADKYFVIAANFTNVIQPHMRISSDKNVTDYYDDKEKDCIWVTRSLAFHPKNTYNILDEIDYWYDDRKEGFETNWKWTLYWLLQLLRKYHQQKSIYIFGMDCHNTERKRYRDGKLISEHHRDNNCKDMPSAFKARKSNEPDFFYGVYNMNPDSAVKCLEFKDYNEL